MSGTSANEETARAEAFLDEAVYQSRTRQALSVTPLDLGPKGAGNCGLGKEAVVELGLTAKAAELLGALWQRAPSESEIARIRDITAEWVELQDRLDRKRNHFLRDFRHEHGFDRAAYSEEQAAAFESGLQAVNDEVNRERRGAARSLLALK